MNLLVAPLELKGTLTAHEAADAMAVGLADALADARVNVRADAMADARADGRGDALADALADGRGEALADARVDGRGDALAVARSVAVAVPRADSAVARRLPLADGGPGTAACVGLRPGLAVVESAKAIGLTLVPVERRRPLQMTSHGVGDLIKAAGTKRVAVTVGGTGTVDLGLGCAHALGVRYRDVNGALVDPRPENFARIATIDRSGYAPLHLEAWLDVWAPLTGPAGAVFRYGGQKGLATADMPALEAEFARIAALTGAALADGDGAGGGLGWALRVLLGATVRSGFDAVAEAVHLDDALAWADTVLTAEGRFDAQSLQGKGPWALAGRARAAGKRAVLFCGSCDVAPDVWRERFADVRVMGPPTNDPAGALTNAVRAWRSAD
jgi:glycerate kinase